MKIRFHPTSAFAVLFVGTFGGCSDRLGETTQAVEDPHYAQSVVYDRTTSQLAANDVQVALDALAARPVNVAGPVGVIGPVGPVGPVGFDGLAGAPGTDGLSATSQALVPGDLFCAAGGTRFEAATGVTYACSGANGAIGASGPQGAMGAVGPFGEIGAMGATGPAGEIGATGSVGPQGPPGATGPTGVSLAPLGWISYSVFDRHFYGVAGSGRTFPVWSSRNFDSQLRFTHTTVILSHVSEVVVATDPSTTPARSIALVLGQGIPKGLEAYTLDDGQPTDIPISFPMMTGPMSIAVANVSPTVGWGGYEPDQHELAFFTIELPSASSSIPDPCVQAAPSCSGGLVCEQGFCIQRTALVLHDHASGPARRTVLLPDLDHLFGNPLGAACVYHVVHDADSRRLLIADECGGAVRVLGYERPGWPITVHGSIPTPSPFPLGYDPIHHILWSGTLGMPIDLASLESHQRTP